MSKHLLLPNRIMLPALLTVMLAVAGCGTAPADSGVLASTASVGAGTYPNLNMPLVPAAAQITAEERAATSDELRLRRDRLASGASAASASSAGQLRQIGSSHAQAAIARIEAD